MRFMVIVGREWWINGSKESSKECGQVGSGCWRVNAVWNV